MEFYANFLSLKQKKDVLKQENDVLNQKIWSLFLKRGYGQTGSKAFSTFKNKQVGKNSAKCALCSAKCALCSGVRSDLIALFKQP